MSFSGIFLAFLLLSLSMSITSGCGKKGPLYIPTAEEQAQMDKDQAKREVVLKRRKMKAQQEEAKTASPTPP